MIHFRNKSYSAILSIVVLCAGLLAVAGLSCCRKNTIVVPEVLGAAEQMLQDGDVDGSRKLCGELIKSMEGSDSLAFGSTDCARLSLLFMQLAEYGNEESNVADAARCLTRALILNEDSVQAFFTALPVADMRHIEILRSIGVGMTADRDSLWQTIPDEADSVSDDIIMME